MAMHWILVCDAAGGKIYESDALLEELALVETLTGGHKVSPGPEAVEAESDPRRIAEDRIARTFAEALNRQKGEYERLIVAAPARLLGELRQVLSTEVQRKTVAWFHHDWTHLGLRALAAQIRKDLPESAGMP